jgi:hypothetical protein
MTLTVEIDVGGAKTRLRACAGTGTVTDHVRTSSGWRPHDTRAAAAWLAALIEDAIPPDTRPDAVAVGGHACETPRQCEEIRSALQARLGVDCLVSGLSRGGDAELLVPAAGGVRPCGAAVDNVVVVGAVALARFLRLIRRLR